MRLIQWQFVASMWSHEESSEIISIAKKVRPSIVTYALPHGLQVEKGSDAVVSHLIERIPELLAAPDQQVNGTEQRS